MFGWMANRWLISIVCLIVLALLIWRFGDQIAIGGFVPLQSPITRIAVALGAVIAWLVWKLVATMRTRKANEEMVDSLAEEAIAAPPDPDQVASQEELDVLRERFRKALTALKRSKLGGKGRSRYLYQLPWYVIIGPPGVGKTTAVVNSGLKFPLLERFGPEGVAGVGGTRNCDWYFTDEAVLIDTAGRWTSQDSRAGVDKTAWQGFLELLRKHRRRRPIDGIIVALSVNDIARADPAAREADAKTVRQRVEEVYAVLKLRAPVYVVVTKCDLVAGFTEFFADLRQRDLEQVWGTTFPVTRSQKPNAALSGFGADFDALIDRLTGRVTLRLQQETDVARRGLLVGFPQQLAILKEPIAEFLNAAFRETTFESPILLRGVYLSSATQEGAPVDRLAGAVAQAFGFERPALPAFATRGRCYFLTQLFREVIFKESALVTPTGFFDRNQPWLLRSYYGAAALVTVLLVTGMLFSYGRNQALVAEADRMAAEYESRYQAIPPGGDNLPYDLWYLTRLRELPGGYGHRDEGRPFLMGLYLYQGDKLGSAALDKYRQGLDTILMPRIMARLEEQLRSALQQGGDLLQTTLKVYLMMTTPGRRDNDLTYDWITQDFELRNRGAEQVQLREEFNSHVRALLALREGPWPEDQRLVNDAQQALLEIDPAQRIYQQIKAEALLDRSPGFSLAMLPASAQRYFDLQSGSPASAGVPSLFTADGYRRLFLPYQVKALAQAREEWWILGPTARAPQNSVQELELGHDVRDLYFQDFIDSWRHFLDDIVVAQSRDVRAQSDLVRALSLPNSPIKSLVEGIAEHTRLVLVSAPDVADKAPSMVQSAITRLIGESDSDALEQAPDPAAVVDAYFQPLHDLVPAEGSGPPPIDVVLNALRPLSQCLDDAALKLQSGRDIAQSCRDIVGACERAGVDVQREARVQPPPLDRWLRTVNDHSLRLVRVSCGEEVTNIIQDAWRARVLPKCQDLISKRYPFARSSPDDVNIADFATFFGPDGILDQFFKEFIRPSVDISRQPWQWSGQVPVGISPNSLRVFEHAATIRDAFFGRNPTPKVEFEVEPVYLDKGSAQVTFEAGDQRLHYRHDARQRARFEWPTTGEPAARVVFIPVSSGARPPTFRAEGDWAVFRLVDSGRISSTRSGDRFTVVFDQDTYRAEFQVHAGSVLNPFLLPELSRFSCKERL